MLYWLNLPFIPVKVALLVVLYNISLIADNKVLILLFKKEYEIKFKAFLDHFHRYKENILGQ